MAFENLFIRTKRSLGGISLDAVISETHDVEIKSTENEIELGASISDHSVILPKRLTIVAQVSDTPLGAAAFGEIVDLVTGLFGTATSENITRSNAAYNAIVQLAEQREPIDVQTKLKFYSNMLIKKISVTRDKDTSRVVLMTIDLQEMLITTSKIVSLSAETLQEGSVREQGTSAEERGRVEAVEPDETTKTSVLKSVLDWVAN